MNKIFYFFALALVGMLNVHGNDQAHCMDWAGDRPYQNHVPESLTISYFELSNEHTEEQILADIWQEEPNIVCIQGVSEEVAHVMYESLKKEYAYFLCVPAEFDKSLLTTGCILIASQYRSYLMPHPSDAYVDMGVPGCYLGRMYLPKRLYRNNLKNGGFGKEDPQNLHSERGTIAERQGPSEDANCEENPTWPKTDSSGCFGINSSSSRCEFRCPSLNAPSLVLSRRCHVSETAIFGSIFCVKSAEGKGEVGGSVKGEMSWGGSDGVKFNAGVEVHAYDKHGNYVGGKIEHNSKGEGKAQIEAGKGSNSKP